MRASKIAKIVITSLVSASLWVGCTKKRDASFPHGVDRDLLLVADYDDKEFPMQTSKSSIKSQSSAKVQAQNPDEAVQNIDFVDYSTKAELVEDVRILGREQHTYNLKYVFEDKVLKVYKLGQTKDLSSDEVASAKKMGTSLAVPLVSYSVTYYSAENARNDNNEKTSKLTLVEEQKKESAKYFKLDRSSKELAKLLAKNTVIGAKDLDGDWYFAATVVSQNYRLKNGSNSSMISIDELGTSAPKVRIKKDEHMISFYNLNIDDQLKTAIDNKGVNQSYVLQIPAEFKDYRFESKGKTTSLREEEHSDKAWTERAYLKLDLEKSQTSVIDQKTTDNELIDLQINKDYFSFVLFSKNTKTKIRYSFYKVDSWKSKNPAYKAKIYFKEDQNIFGFFFTEKNTLTEDRNRPLEMAKDRLVERYNPARQKISFHLNHDAPDWSVKLAEEAIVQWNQGFKQAGSNLLIELDTKKRVDLGDLRYNIINLIPDIDGNEPFWGVGPHVSDSETGEIIAGSVNVNLADIVNVSKSALRNYIQYHLGRLDEKFVLGLAGMNSNSVDNAAATSSKRVYNRQEKKFVKVSPSAKKSKPGHTLSRQEAFFDFGSGDLVKEIDKSCPELKVYAETVKRSRDQALEDKIVGTCALTLAKPRVSAILTHELGHVFGLRHNFYGSTDWENFEEKYRTSSAMDYLSFTEWVLPKPGRYDIAAIRWGYNEQVESKDGSIIPVSGSVPLKAQNISNLRSFKYCTDEDIDYTPKDPRCARHDSGVSPLEIVENLISEYYADVAIRNQRHDLNTLPNAEKLLEYRKDGIFKPLKRFYDQWRAELVALTGSGKGYLENYSLEEYQNLIAPLKCSGNECYQNYVKSSALAAQRVYEFFRDLAFRPDRYCVTEKSGVHRLHSFSLLQKDLQMQTGQTALSCEQPEIKNLLAKYDSGANYVNEIGFPVEDLKSELNSVGTVLTSWGHGEESPHIDDSTQVLGLMADRGAAFEMLASREIGNHINATQNLMPNFFDEPTHRIELEQMISDRLLKGVPIKNNFSANFQTEYPLLPLMMETLLDGVLIPDKMQISDERRRSYIINSDNSLSNDEKRECVKFRGLKYCATYDSPLALNIVKKLNESLSIKSAAVPSPEAIKQYKELVQPHLPPAVFTVENMVDIRNSLEKIENTNPVLGAQLKLLHSICLKPEIEIFNEGPDELLTKAFFDKKNMVEFRIKQKEIFSMSLAQIAESNEAEWTLTGEEFEKRIADFREKWAQSKASYEANQTELEAQSNLLMQTINLMF